MDISSNENVQFNFSQEIINYLANQEVIGECIMIDPVEVERHRKKHEVRQILSCILNKIEVRGRLKREHEERVKAHNQYPLFDISKVVKDAWIDDEYYDQMTFRETLVVSKVEKDSTLKAVGGLCLDIQSALGTQLFKRKFEKPIIHCDRMTTEDNYWAEMNKYEDDATSERAGSDDDVDYKKIAEEIRRKLQRSHTKFLVHLNSQVDVDGKNGGSRMTSWVDRNFHTLEEKRKEFIVEEGENLKEKSLYIALQKQKYYIKYNSRPDNTREKKFYSLQKARDFIGEGASFVLMRFLAIYRHFGTFEMSTMYVNGDMCRNIYQCNGPQSGIVNGKKLDLCKIYRVIIEECGIEHKSCTVLTLQGQIIKHEWEDCDYVLHVNPLATILNEKPQGNDIIVMKNNWQDDMQLFSQYLDEKNTCSLLVRSYMLDHPELNHIIADYIQHILMLKPAEILEFTINHFKNFAPHYFPRNEYFDYSQPEEEELFTI